MSLAYYIVLDNEDPGFETFVNGKAVAHAVEELDALCAREGLARLDDFMGQSADEISDLLGEDVEFPDGEGGLWFEPEAGLALVETLAAKILANPQLVGDPDAVLADFAEYKDVLAQARNIKAKWHLAIDM